MAICFKQFLKILPAICEQRQPILMRGDTGIGKSQLVYQQAEKMGMRVIECRAAYMTEGDLCGLPILIEKGTNPDGSARQCTMFGPPDWLLDACDEPVILFLDEIDRGVLEVRQGFFELTGSRKHKGHPLHPGTIVFAAINGGEGDNDYLVGSMDPAELDRWWIFDLDPTVQDWLDWAKGNPDIHSTVWDFISRNDGHLDYKGIHEPGKIYPSRRSWHHFSKVAKMSGYLTEEYAKSISKGEGAKISIQDNLDIINLAAAKVGCEAAVAFTDFLSTYRFRVTIEDIFDNGKLDLIEKWDLPDHIAFVRKIVKERSLNGVLTPKQMQNFTNYWGMAPPELITTVFKELGIAETTENMQAWHKSSIQLDKLPGKLKGEGTVMAKYRIVDAFGLDPTLAERCADIAELRGSDDEEEDEEASSAEAPEAAETVEAKPAKKSRKKKPKAKATKKESEPAAEEPMILKAAE